MAVNKVILVGNLGKDPEIRYTHSGTAVVSFSLATTERFKDKDGNKQTKTEWHNIIAWGNLAEICAKWLTKGKQIYVEGKIQNRSYDDSDRKKCYISEVVIHDMKMLGAKPESQNHTATAVRQQQQPPQQNQNQGGGGMNPEPTFNPDDEIPFAYPMLPRELK